MTPGTVTDLTREHETAARPVGDPGEPDPLPAIRWSQPPAARWPASPPLQRYIWGQLRSRTTDPRLVAASLAQIPLFFVAIFLASWSNSLGLLPIIASIVLGQLAHTDIVADNTGVRQIGVGSWAVPWETIERIEILPGGKSWLWGTQPPRLILHIRPDAALGRGTLRRLRRRGRIETRLRPSLIQVFMGLAGQKGIPVEIPQPLPTAPHIEPNVLGPGGSE